MTVSLLRLSTATIEHIAILNAMVSVFYCAATRILLSKYSKGLNYPIKLNTFLIRQNATFAINAWWVNLVAIALLHFDRLVLVHYLDLEQYGTYCAVYSAVAAVYGLVLPAISNALAVRFATLQSQIASDLEAEHRFASQSLSLLSALGLITCAILTQPAMQLWQAPLPYARDIALLATILSLGHSANALMIPNHVLMLCQGNAAVPARLSTILALIFLPLLVLLSAFFGKYGAATNFACMNIAYAILGLYVAHRLRLTSQATSIVIRDTLPPSLLAISVGMITCLGLLKLTPMQAIFVYLLVITSSALTIKFLMPDFFSRLTLRHLTRKYSNTY
jgi:O-antigen/teichoic acid export membrane protein